MGIIGWLTVDTVVLVLGRRLIGNLMGPMPGMLLVAKAAFATVIVLIEADPRRAGCRLRWFKLHHLATQQGIRVVKLQLPSNKLLSKHDLPKITQKLPKGIRLWLREVGPKLRRAQFLFTLARSKVVVVGKPNDERVIDGMQFAKRFRTSLIVDACDIKTSYRYIQKAFDLATYITLPTKHLGAKIPAKHHHKIRIIPDGLDTTCLPNNTTDAAPRKTPKSPLNILWFGVIEASGPSERPSFSIFCDVIAQSIDVLQQNQATITLVCSHSQAAQAFLAKRLRSKSLACQAMEWSQESMQQALASPGIALLPYQEPITCCDKSPNRLELAFYAGKTVMVNGRLPSLDQELTAAMIEIDRCIDQSMLNQHQDNLVKQQRTRQMARRHLDHKQTTIDQLWTNLLT
tara:strand:- start:683 stop:1888 length:1206 start_codon:yes stop_codon:yes gene_type:complete